MFRQSHQFQIGVLKLLPTTKGSLDIASSLRQCGCIAGFDEIEFGLCSDGSDALLNAQKMSPQCRPERRECRAGS